MIFWSLWHFKKYSDVLLCDRDIIGPSPESFGYHRRSSKNIPKMLGAHSSEIEWYTQRQKFVSTRRHVIPWVYEPRESTLNDNQISSTHKCQQKLETRLDCCHFILASAHRTLWISRNEFSGIIDGVTICSGSESLNAERETLLPPKGFVFKQTLKDWKKKYFPFT